MHVLYVTVQTPWGRSEAFILPEIIEIRRQGHRVTVCPLRPQKKIAPGKEPVQVADDAVHLPLLGWRTLCYAALTTLWRPLPSVRIVLRLLRSSGGARKLIKNLAVVPKGLALAWLTRCLRPDHIHAHWASTPSSAAFIAAEITGTSWSFTAHRWDIKERNALALKIRSAVFARAISEKGTLQLRKEVPSSCHSKVFCIHMGASFSGTERGPVNDDPTLPGESTVPIIACPANLLPVKGHTVLLEACTLLQRWQVSFRCLLFGQGPLEYELKRMSERAGLGTLVEWRGHIPHDELLDLYRSRKVSLVVLPSIVTEDGEEEGIPVSLIEAMSAGIPVVSTLTGSIPELLRGGAGLLVPERDPYALAQAIRGLLDDPILYRATADAGRKRVEEAFSVERTVSDLIASIESYTQTGCSHRGCPKVRGI